MTEPQKYRIEGRPRTIYRTVKNVENPFVMIDRRPIDNKALSFKAKGLLTYLMSRPDGWEVSVADLINHSPEGEASVRSGLKELKKAGHMKYTKMRSHGRITGWLIEIYESPHLSPDGDFLHVENLDVENRTQVLSTLSITDLNVNERTATLAKLYSVNIGALTPILSDKIKEAAETFTDATWYEPAFEVAVFNNARNWNYVETVLTNWKDKGRGWKPTPMKTNSRTKVSVPMQFDAQGNVIG